MESIETATVLDPIRRGGSRLIRTSFSVCGAVLICLFGGCESGGVPLQEIERRIVAGVSSVTEFHRLFPGARGTVAYSANARSAWTSSVGLHGRYIFGLSVAVEHDRGWKTISGGEPIFTLFEIESVQTDSSGRVRVAYTGFQKSFGREDWARLKEGNGDFSAIGIKLTTESPVARFAEAFSTHAP
jgi:hypothetical protein